MDSPNHAVATQPVFTTQTTADTLDVDIVDAVARAKGVDPLDVEPLYCAVDPDALTSLFAPTDRGFLRADGAVSFPYAGCDVRVRGGKPIRVEVFRPQTEEVTAVQRADESGR